jgi:hypothetical protein
MDEIFIDKDSDREDGQVFWGARVRLLPHNPFNQEGTQLLIDVCPPFVFLYPI